MWRGGLPAGDPALIHGFVVLPLPGLQLGQAVLPVSPQFVNPFPHGINQAVLLIHISPTPSRITAGWVTASTIHISAEGIAGMTPMVQHPEIL